MLLDRCPDVPQFSAWLDRLDSAPKALVSYFAQATSLNRYGSDLEHPARVTMESILDDGNVDVEYVALP